MLKQQVQEIVRSKTGQPWVVVREQIVLNSIILFVIELETTSGVKISALTDTHIGLGEIYGLKLEGLSNLTCEAQHKLIQEITILLGGLVLNEENSGVRENASAAHS